MSEAPDYLEVLACFIGECPSDIRTYSLRAVTPSALGALARDLTEADERGGGTETVFSAWAAVSEDT